MYVNITEIIRALTTTSQLLALTPDRNALRAFATDPTLNSSWERTAPEVRTVVLLAAAWQARQADRTPISRGGDLEQHYAVELAKAAHEWADQYGSDDAAFTAFINTPAAGRLLASSLAFDRDDTPLSLLVVLTLTARFPKHRP
ncbi:hypothetical protein ACGFRG_05800 [Streptomyces sp. NPDC048696]|uniref:hypothetical protein n=1 Tax=Streptomyces sp. NPDC048696 TaxID=3365585 RepID=UPI0037225F7B